jgi:hypothetical protein
LPVPTNGWVEVWNVHAEEKLKNVQHDSQKAISARQKHPAKILKWTPEVKPKNYLRALGVASLDLVVREDADKFDVTTGQWKKK